MRLHAAFVPPRPALAELDRAVRDARRADVSAPVRAGLFRRHPASQPPTLVPLTLDHTSMVAMQVPVAGFGNVTTADAQRVVEGLVAAAAQWPRPQLHFAGVEVFGSSASKTVWARVDGDVDGLREISRGVTRCVEHIGFFVDRRRFYQGVEVARSTPATSEADMETIVAVLEAYVGRPWTIDHLTIFTTVATGERVAFREFEQIPLGVDDPR